ncbi:MAG: polysaccharide biosynthesis/export family protein [Candidatus Omnitrophica bacterium]|nr:polysaccharide biosynthesis/export family protein [Candidatus Omnitrophota bacterium]
MYKCNKINQIVYFMIISLFFCFGYVYGVAEGAAIKEFGLKEPEAVAEKTIIKEFGLKEPEGVLKEELMAKARITRPLEYIISEEDVMDITVWQLIGILRSAGEGEEREYTITRGDVLEISVWQWPDLAKDVIVRPDGKISFPLVGDIDVEGLTLTELDEILTTKLSDYIKAPQVSVMIKSFGGIAFGRVPEEEVVSIAMPYKKLGDLSTGAVVRPDGRISLPLIGDVQASGLTLNELKNAITEKLSQYMEGPEVSISMKTFGGKKIIILGEVSSPGVYRPPGNIDVIEAIGLAGGYTEDAILKSVMVVRGDLDNPVAIRLNINNVIKKGDLSENIMIQPHDIVYVPKNFIEDINYFLNNILAPLTSASSAVPAIKTIRIGPSPKR